MLSLGVEETMSMQDFYWLPSAGTVTYEWVWLYAHRRTLEPVRGRAAVGILGLVLTTAASLSLLTAVIHSWVVGSFTWSTPLDGCGLLLGLLAILVGVVSKGRLRLLTTTSAALSVAGWAGYLMARRVGL
jgi:hypothetical protein